MACEGRGLFALIKAPTRQEPLLIPLGVFLQDQLCFSRKVNNEPLDGDVKRLVSVFPLETRHRTDVCGS